MFVMVRTVVQHQKLPGRGGWSQLRGLPRGSRCSSCSGASWGWLHRGLWRGFFIQAEYSGLEEAFKGHLIPTGFGTGARAVAGDKPVQEEELGEAGAGGSG